MSNEEMIYCDRCGAPLRKNQRCCMKCGRLNYSHPDNASMLKYANEENDSSKKKGTFFNVNTNIGNVKDTQFNLLYADHTGDKSTCIVTNICLLLLGFIGLFLYFYTIGNDVLEVFTSPLFNISAIGLVLIFLEAISYQFLYMRANMFWWSFFIPFYGLYAYCKMATGNKTIAILSLIPGLGIIPLLISMYSLGKKFGYHGLYSLLLQFIFVPVVAFNTAVSYDGIYYIQRNTGVTKEELGKDYRGNKSLLYMSLVLMALNLGVLVYFNYDRIVNIFNDSKFTYDTKRIFKIGKNSLLNDRYRCNNDADIRVDDGTYYVAFGLAGFGFNDYDDYSEYKGYIKVVNKDKKQKFFIAIHNNKRGIKETSFSKVMDGELEMENQLFLSIPDGVVVCYKK